MHFLPFILPLLLTATSGNLTAAKSWLSVERLASASAEFDKKPVQVEGTLCNIGLGYGELQATGGCNDSGGIRLELRGVLTPQLEGAHVVIAGIFANNSTAPDALNYPQNRYFGNYTIFAKEIRVLPAGPNNSFKPKPLRGSA